MAFVNAWKSGILTRCSYVEAGVHWEGAIDFLEAKTIIGPYHDCLLLMPDLFIIKATNASPMLSLIPSLLAQVDWVAEMVPSNDNLRPGGINPQDSSIPRGWALDDSLSTCV